MGLAGGVAWAARLCDVGGTGSPIRARTSRTPFLANVNMQRPWPPRATDTRQRMDQSGASLPRCRRTTPPRGGGGNRCAGRTPGRCDRRGSGRADDHAGSTGIRSCTGRGPRGDKRGVPPQRAPAPDEPRGGGGPLRRGEPRGSDRLSPQMVGELAAACRALHARQGWLRLIATAPCVVSALESAGVEDLFPIYRAARTEFREVS